MPTAAEPIIELLLSIRLRKTLLIRSARSRSICPNYEAARTLTLK